MEVSSDILKLFTAYAQAFDKLDFRTQAEFFADTFIMAGPKGAISQSKNEFLKSAEQAVAFYKSVGMNSAKMLSIKQNPISTDYIMVTIHWGATFGKTGIEMQEFDLSYIVHTSLPEPKIILAISHKDEDETMKKLGLLASK